jgi:hypothetical protein
MPESHRVILRLTYVRNIAQCEEGGIRIGENHLGCSTSFQAVFGAQPSVLPDLDQCDAVLDDSNILPDGISKHRRRVRGIAVQNVVETKAEERLARALRSKTRKSAQAEKYEQCDQVGFFRSPSGKEISGWRGPGEMFRVEEGAAIRAKWRGRAVIRQRPPDVRRAPTFWPFSRASSLSRTTSAQTRLSTIYADSSWPSTTNKCSSARSTCRVTTTCRRPRANASQSTTTS